MTVASGNISMTEWQYLRPEPGSVLKGRTLGSDADRALAGRLADAGLLEVTELRDGLMVRSFSHVGKVCLGDIEITVSPKLDDHASLLNLLRYAYGFRKLKLFPDSAQRLGHSSFADILVYQLNVEARELIARGLHRTYVPRKDWLSTPKGRIDIQRLATQGGLVSARLPCNHHPRVEDSLLNQVLLGGLRLAGSLASDLQLRRESRRLASMFDEQVSTLRLDGDTLERVGRQMNRLTAAYTHAVTVIRLLHESAGTTLTDTGLTMQLPGFLFDMNRFFQALLSRFLRENLPEHTLRDEFRLRGMMQFIPGFTSPYMRPPVPRPDFVLLDRGRPVAILDAKYRDLWEKSLPREMLYQLAVYAGSHEMRSATILYPTICEEAKEVRIGVRDPVFGRQSAQVNLRPVVLGLLEDLVLSGHSASVHRSRMGFARWLALGEPTDLN